MVLTLVMILTIGMTCFAKDDVHNLVTTPPSIQSSGGITPNLATPPGSSASVQNLSISAYNYQVQSVGYRVYTDKWLTGVSNYNITINNWTCVDNSGPPNYNRLTISVYNSLGNLMTSMTIDPTITRAITLTSMTASKNYYVCFEVPTNGNKFSFDGSID
jgi:hypothetical protein